MLLHKICNDETGAVISAELVFILTILVIGLVCGMVELRAGIATELDDVGNAIGHLNQSYAFSGCGGNQNTRSCFTFQNCIKGFAVGSFFFDSADACDDGCAGVSTILCDAPVLEANCGIGVGTTSGATWHSDIHVTPSAPDITVAPSCAPVDCAPIAPSCAP